MVFSKEDRILIKELRREKGYGAKRLLKEFPGKNWSIAALNRLLRKIETAGTADRSHGGGKQRTLRTAENVEAVGELISSQDDQPGTHHTIRQISRLTGIPKSSVHDIIHKDLNLKCIKKRRAQELTPTNKLTRLVSAKQLLRRYPEHLVQMIWFTDEKVFTVTTPKNSQNDRLYVPIQTRKKTVSADRLLRTRSTFSKSVMVSVGVSVMGRTNLIFVEPGIKINGQYYRDVLLSQHLLPAIREVAGENFIFQQDSAPAHRAHETVAFLERETPAFIPPTHWPSNSPDLNPVDYRIWGILQDRVYQTRIRNVEHLKERLLEEWNQFNQGIINSAVNQWRRRLRACVQAQGGHFEHQL